MSFLKPWIDKEKMKKRNRKLETNHILISKFKL